MVTRGHTTWHARRPIGVAGVIARSRLWRLYGPLSPYAIAIYSLDLPTYSLQMLRCGLSASLASVHVFSPWLRPIGHHQDSSILLAILLNYEASTWIGHLLVMPEHVFIARYVIIFFRINLIHFASSFRCAIVAFDRRPGKEVKVSWRLLSPHLHILSLICISTPSLYPAGSLQFYSIFCFQFQNKTKKSKMVERGGGGNVLKKKKKDHRQKASTLLTM